MTTDNFSIFVDPSANSNYNRLKYKANIEKLSNETLFERYRKEGDGELFGLLFRRYMPLLYGLCLKYLENEADAQDAVMDLYEEVSRKICRYEIHNFHTWLYSVAKNHCLWRLRKEKRFPKVNIDDVVMENGDFFTLLDREKTTDEEAALVFCIKELNEAQRRSIEYFYFENKSYADIVSLTGYTLQKVKSYIQNGKRNLKNCIERMMELKVEGLSTFAISEHRSKACFDYAERSKPLRSKQ